MIHIFIDSNSWIDFSEGKSPHDKKVLQDISTYSNHLKTLLINQKIGRIKLLTNDVVLKEVHFEKIQENVKNHIEKKKKELQDLTIKKYKNDFTTMASKAVLEEFEKTINEKLEIDLNKRVEHAQLIKQCILSIYKTPPITLNKEKKIIDLALNKRAMFRYKNNSVADALIILSFIEHMQFNMNDKAVFITDDKDFYDDKKMPDKDIIDLFNGINISFFSTIAKALSVLKKEEKILSLSEVKASVIN